MSADRLTSQLYHLPAIIGRLGLSVANAQKALNADYTQNIKELIAVIKDLIPASDPDTRATVESFIRQLAPSRYQFTETTLDFSADLSESLDVAGSIGLGAGFGAVVVNAGLSVGFGRDYRAAARIKTILHAIPADEQSTAMLLSQADKLTSDGVTLPPRTEASTAVNNNLRDIVRMTGGADLPKLAPETPLSPLARIQRAAKDAKDFRVSAGKFKDVAEDEATSAEGKTAAATEARNAARAARAAADSAKADLDEVEDSQSEAAKALVEAADADAKAADEAATAAEKAAGSGN
ncbi:hypothetical protein [Luteolibacter marinus]|uniref:hypothetical protein n=1 Tax=Luteolibacter marinus TaxID=2776705 RepID=UPI001868D2D3|nr:hypothetical protein [Luteolibacter marinus]